MLINITSAGEDCSYLHEMTNPLDYRIYEYTDDMCNYIDILNNSISTNSNNITHMMGNES
jgi:hypothetical protein